MLNMMSYITKESCKKHQLLLYLLLIQSDYHTLVFVQRTI